MKRNVKIKVIVAIVAVAVICLSAFIPFALQESKLNNLQQTAIAELNSRRGGYDEQSIVLEDTSKAEAEYLAERFGAKLRITADGSYARLTLPGGVTIKDVYSEMDNRRYLNKMSADYSAKVSDISESDSMRLPTAPYYTVSDDAYSLQSYLNYINIRNAWNNYYRGSGVTVAVIDTGIDTDHPEFAGKISEYSYNATEDKIVKDYTTEDGSYDWSLVEDKVGHGTAVAGVIAASMDGNGIVGIAPEVNLVVIKAECNEEGEFYRTSDLVFGLYYAVERDVDVVNMSFGGGSNSYAKPAKLAVDNDIICVAAAGNESTSALTYPAADENVIGVGALADGSWELAQYSNFGENTDLVAPGTVYTTTLDGGYKTMHGTSFASPIVAAAMALLKQQNRYMEFADVTELLYASCYDIGAIGKDWYFGYGALDIDALICQPRHTVIFDMLTDELEDIKQVFIEGNPLQNIPEPDRNYAVFDGWCYDLECKEDLDWYVDAWQNDITLYARWANEDDAVPYTYVTLPDNTIEIRSYTGHRRFITIPEKIDNKIVSSIGDFAFQNQNRLREVNLPSGLNNIGASAFANCNNLLGIVIPDGVTTIGGSAFSNNVRLQTVSLNNTSKLKTIGDSAFSNSGLLRFDVTARVEYLNGSAFFGATSLANINVAKENKNFLSDDGVLHNKTKSTVVAYPAGKSGEYVLPNGVTKIGGAAFGYAKLKNIDFNNVTSIDGSAFARSSLENVVLTDKITAIGKESFAYCANLSSLTIGGGLTTLPEKAFVGTLSLVSVEIPSNIVSIGGKAFSESGLRTLTFAENSQLLEIGISAFAGCGIQSVVFPQSLFVIGGGAFANNFALSSVTFAQNSNLQYIGKKAFMNAVSLTQIDLPNKLVSLGEFAFAGSGLTGSVTIPSSVTDFGAGAFASCHSLTDIIVESGNEAYKDIDGVVYTVDGKTLVEYPAGNSRTGYTVLDGTENVYEDAFYGSYIINYVYLPESLQEIQREAFYDVENLYSITIPDNVVQISNYAFAECWNLYSVSISDSSKLPRISYAAFAYSGINTFRVPANVSTIAQSAFEGCRNLYSVTFAENSKLPSISAYMFKGADNLQTITFENGSALTSIQAHGLEGMKTLTSVDFGDAKLTNIDNYAFRYCESLQSITIPEGVTYIGRFAFYGDKALSRFDLPATIDYIGRYAFYGTTDANVYFASEFLPNNLQENWDNGIAGYHVGVTDVLTSGDWKYATLADGGVSVIKYTGTETVLDLTSLDLGGEIRQIGGYAFYRSGVTQITLPETVNTIQRYAFAYSNLKSVALPKAVRFVGQYAFYHTAVESVDIPEDSELAKVEQYAFAQNDSLATITLPSSLEDIGTFVFYGSALKTLNYADGFGMTKIPEYAFADTDLISVTIPDSVNYIDNSAFRDCLNLQTVNFGSAQDLQLHANAFYNTGLSAVNIPTNLRYVGEYALIGLQNLQSYEVDENNPYYKSVDGVLYTKDGKKLIAFPAGRTGSFVVPAFVETIGFGAFENTKLNGVSFEEGINLLTLGYRAFYNAQNLTEVAIPASMVSIDYYAFAECRNLQKVTFAEENKLTGIYEGAFLNCINLSDIVIPDSIVEISDFAFYGCTSITKLPISENSALRGIYDYAFAYTGLTELTVPDAVIDIGAYAFRGTPVKKVYISDAQLKTLQIDIGALQDCDVLEDLRIPFSGNAYGGEYPWFGYIFGAGNVWANFDYVSKTIKKLSITQIENLDWDSVFVASHYFENTLWGSIEEVHLPVGLSSVGTQAFYDCLGLVSITIPDGVTSIGNSAFSRCSNLTSITIPDSVIFVDRYAFSDCSSLTNIRISKNITRIEDGLFSNCTSLTDVEIHEGITSIGNGAFSSCIGLTSIIIPQTVSDIDENAFHYCDNLCQVINKSELLLTIGGMDNGFIACYAKLIIDKNGNKTYKDELDFEFIDTSDGFRFVKESDGYKLVSYIGNKDTVTLPININGNAYSIYKLKGVKKVIIPDGVTTIGNNAFYECSSLTDITIPNSVISIGKNAFYNCRCLENVVISNSVASIGESAFEGCYSLINISLPNNIKRIEEYTFRDCSALKNVQIPDSVTSINFGAFSGCCSLVNINLPQSISGIADYVFYDCSNLKEISIPAGVRYIGMYSFENCTNLNNVVVPHTITQISEHAFYNCTDLMTYHIGKEVYYVGKNAFSGCPKLKLTIDADNKEFSLVDGVLYDKEIREILYIPDAIKSVVVPKTVGCLSAFERNTNIVEVRFEEGSSIAIGQSVFSGCSSLVNIVIPYGATFIGDYAFYGCKSLTSIVIPETVTTIGRYAFGDCCSLVSIIIPKKVTSIEEYLFYGCSSLASVAIPETVTTIGSGAFSGCNSLTSVIIPETVVDIGNYAFSRGGLTSVKIPSNITSIGEGLFDGCSSLASVAIPETVTAIEDEAFQNCSNLTNITIPSRLTILNDYVFYGCNSLTSIEIPCGINSIGTNAFYGCNNLYKIVNKSDLTLTIGGIENGYIAYNAKLIIDKNGNAVYKDGEAGFEYIDTVDGFRFVKDSSGYKLLSYLGDLDTIGLPIDINDEQYSIWYMRGVKNVVIPEGITSIGDYAFYGCNSLVRIVMPETVTNIGDCAFYGCVNLIDISFSDKITDIGTMSFFGCTSLVSVVMPKSIINIGFAAFMHCSSLKNIIIPDGVKEIDVAAFNDCNNLNNIELPDSVSRIGKEAFYSTAYYHDSRNWDGEYLYIGKHLIKINAAHSDRIHIRPDTICIADDVFEDCSKLIEISIGGNHWLSLRNIANLETLLLMSLPTEHNIADYFYDGIPLALKNIVLKKGCKIDQASLFYDITGVTIYVEDEKIACPWNEDIPGWNNGNKVYYGGEWINAEFRDADGKVITSDYYTTSQVVRQPYVASIPNGRTKLVFAGWDLDGDGIADSMPATSGKNISATAVMKEVPNTFTASYLGLDGEVLFKQTYVYGDAIVLPNAPQKKGYTFDGWLGFTDGMTIETDMSFESMWTHNGDGHVYDVSTVAPTCDEQGYDKHVCSICDHEWRDNYVDALGHNYGDWTLTTAPTCTDEGLQTHTCLTCGHVETQAVAAVGHDFVINVTKNATCTHEGLANYVCATCGHTEVQPIETIEHSYHKHVVPKSWLRMLLEMLSNIFFGYEGSGVYYYQCDMCGKVMASDGVAAMSSSAQGTCIHQPEDWKVTLKPSCQSGLEARVCSLCGRAVEVRVTEANGEHVLGDWYTKQAPDCTHTGIERRDCAYCDYFETKELSALGHTHSAAVEENRIEANCTTDGHCDSVVYCTECNEELSRTQVTLPKLGHDLTHHDGKEATCTEKGWDEYDTCIRCDYTTYNEIAALGHTEVVDEAVAPTCTKTGLTEGKHCSACGEVLVAQKVVSALKHDMGEWQQTKAPSCTEVGEERRYCSRCDHFEARELAVIGHAKGNAVEENRVEATCTTDGHYDSVVYCSVCNEELSRAQVTLPKLGHALTHHDGKGATCTEKGWSEYDTCSRCSYTTYSEIVAIGHTEVVDKAVAPTCTKTGLTEGKHCSVCGEVLVVQKVVSALNHDMDEWQQTKAPSCTEVGEERRYCSRCDYFETKELAALGHTETDWIVDKEATCVENGSKHKGCSVCHEHLTTETIAAHGHQFGDWTTAVEPTTKAEGKMTRTCEFCGQQEEKSMDKLPKQGCFGTISSIGGVVATVSILAVIVFVVKKKRKLK